MAHVQMRREFSNNTPYWDGVSGKQCFEWGGFMRFDRSAGGHNFDFDTDVCTRCGIARRQYRDGGTPGCADQKVVRLVAAINAPATRLNVPAARLSAPSPIASA
jgi:hypothetical protein